MNRGGYRIFSGGGDSKILVLVNLRKNFCSSSGGPALKGYFGIYLAKKCPPPLAPPSELKGGIAQCTPPHWILPWWGSRVDTGPWRGHCRRRPWNQHKWRHIHRWPMAVRCSRPTALTINCSRSTIKTIDYVYKAVMDRWMWY